MARGFKRGAFPFCRAIFLGKERRALAAVGCGACVRRGCALPRLKRGAPFSVLLYTISFSNLSFNPTTTMRSLNRLILSAALFAAGVLSFAAAHAQQSHHADSPAFALDLREAAGLFDQRLTAGQAGAPLFLAGALDVAETPENRYRLTLDIAGAAQAGQAHVVEFALVSGSTSPDFPSCDEAQVLGLGGEFFRVYERNRWRARLPAGQTAMALHDVSIYLPLANGFWSSQDFAVPDLRWWRPAHYTYRVYREGGSTVLAQGEFVLGRVTRVGASAVSTTRRPVILVHGYGIDGGYFHRWKDARLPPADTIAGRLSQSRAVFAMDVPNTGDIRVSSALFERLADHVIDHLGVNEVDAIGHSMGGLIIRHFLQFRDQQEPLRLRRYVTLGSPLEGSVIAEVALRPNNVLLALVGLIQAARFLGQETALLECDLAPLVDTLMTPAARQLADPQGQLGLWSNDAAPVRHDPNYLPILGTNPISLGDMVLPGVDAVSSLLTNPWFLTRFGDLFGLFFNGSDGLTPWGSGGKRPINQSLNYYVNSTHAGYNVSAGARRELWGAFDLGYNAELGAMLGNIETFLNFGLGQIPLSPAPESPLQWSGRRVMEVATGAGEAIKHAAVGIFDNASNLFTPLGALSDVTGMTVLPESVALRPGQQIMAVAAGMSPLILGGRDEAGIAPMSWVDAGGGPRLQAAQSGTDLFSLPERIVLQPDPAFTGPRGTGVRINGGALTTRSTSLSLEIIGENIAEVLIAEDGWSDGWQAYAPLITHSLVNRDAGLKTIMVGFRSSNGTMGAVAAESIFFNPAASGGTGTLAITDDFGNAAIRINGQTLDRRTPATLTELPAGEYLIELRSTQGFYTRPQITVNLTVNGLVEVHFQREETAEGLWHDATNYADGWKGLEWFGLFHDVGDGWIYHAEHGWWYVAAESTASLWIYDAQLEVWAWTADWVYPWIYFAEPVDAWTLYDRGGRPGNRWFFHTGAQEWRHEGNLMMAPGVVYFEDFTSDPGFDSLKPGHLFWDASNGVYHINTRRYADSSALRNAYMAKSPVFARRVDPEHESFSISMRVNPRSPGYANYPAINLADSRELLIGPNVQTFTGLHLRYVIVSWADHVPRRMQLREGNAGLHFESPTVVANTWYRVEITFDAAEGRISWEVRDETTGQLFASESTSGISLLPFDQIVVGHAVSAQAYNQEAVVLIDWIEVKAEDHP
jgi:pimeloyl-ACP methyl ester carboxylesterase